MYMQLCKTYRKPFVSGVLLPTSSELCVYDPSHMRSTIDYQHAHDMRSHSYRNALHFAGLLCRFGAASESPLNPVISKALRFGSTLMAAGSGLKSTSSSSSLIAL